MCHLFDRSARTVIFIYSSDWKTQLGRRCWDLASCQISLNLIRQFQRRSQKCLSQLWAMATIFFFYRSARKTDLVMDVEILFPVKFRRILFSGFRKKSKISQPIRGWSGHLVFTISPKNTNLVEDVEILLPVKFRWIPFSGFRQEVDNVSANQRPGRSSYFSDRPEKHKLGRGHWDLLSCQVLLNSVQRFQRRSQKYLSQSEAGAAILFFRSAPKTQTW